MNTKVYFPLRSHEPLKNQRVGLIFSGVAPPIRDKHFTDDRFLKLNTAGPTLILTLKLSPDQYHQVPLAQLQTSGQVSQLIYLCVAFLYVVTLLTCYLVTLMFVALALQLTAHSLSLV